MSNQGPIQKLRIMTFILAIAFTKASAGIPVSDWQSKFEGREYSKTYLIGVARGIEQANVRLMIDQRELLYCPPMKLAINVETYFDILNDEIRTQSNWTVGLDPSTPIELLLLKGLQRTFPCDQPKNEDPDTKKK